MNSEAHFPTLDQLHELPLFHGLPPDSLGILRASSTVVEVEIGTEIKTPSGLVHVVLGGEVNCFIRDAADQKFLLGRLTKGDVLGELSYLLPAGGNDEKVELDANSPVTCIQIPAGLFFEIVSRNSEANLVLLEMVSGRLSAMNRFAIKVVNIEIDPTAATGRTWSERLADLISDKVGSWHFMLGGLIFSAGWMAVNAVAWAGQLDPYPFIFLNLLFSLMSAATMPVLLMSQNRQSQLDRMAARVNHMVTLRTNQHLGGIQFEIAELRRMLEKMAEKKHAAD